MNPTTSTGKTNTTGSEDARNEAIRRYLQRVINEDFGGVVSRAARAFGVTNVTLADFLSGRRRAGLKLIFGVAAHRGVTLNVVLGRADPVNAVDGNAGTIVDARIDGESAPAEEKTASAQPPTTMALYFGEKPIHVRDEMTSLTDMWRAAGSDESKRPYEWLRSTQAVEFREFLEESVNTGDSRISLVDTERGVGGGTWAHWQLAMAYAKYLSPKVHAWCNEIVRAHFSGKTAPATVFGPQSPAFAQTVAAISAATFREAVTFLKADITATVEERIRSDLRRDASTPSISTQRSRRARAEMMGPRLLRAWREGRYLTRAAAAAVMGVSAATYGEWELGRNIPRTAHAERIERITSWQVPFRSWCPKIVYGGVQ